MTGIMNNINLEKSINQFGIAVFMPSKDFQEDKHIKETLIQRVFTLNVYNSDVEFYLIDEGCILLVPKREILSYAIDTDWRAKKEWDMMKVLAHFVRDPLLFPSVSGLVDGAIDTFDVICNQYLKQIFIPSNIEQKYIDVLVGDYKGEGQSRAFKVSMTIPFKEFNTKEHSRLIQEDTLKEEAINILGINVDPELNRLKENINFLNNSLSYREPHIRFLEHSQSVHLEDDTFYLELNWYYSFSRVFASKGAAHRMLVTIANEIFNYLKKIGVELEQD